MGKKVDKNVGGITIAADYVIKPERALKVLQEVQVFSYIIGFTRARCFNELIDIGQISKALIKSSN